MTDMFFGGVDHITIGVKSLSDAVRTYERLGFVVTPKGHHDGMGTSNHCIMMEGDYLELATPVAGTEDSKPRRYLEASLSQYGDGVKAVAFATDDGAGLSQKLRDFGWPVDEPEAVYRNIAMEAGKALRARLSVVRFPSETLSGVESAAVQHLSSGEFHEPEWMQHPNGVIATTSLTLVVDDPLQEKDAYEKLFGAGVAAITDSTVTIHLGNHRIFLCSPEHLTQLHPDLELDDLPAPPTPVAMGLKVKNVAATEQILKANEVHFFHLQEGVIRVPPSETHGTLLEFSEED